MFTFHGIDAEKAILGEHNHTYHTETDDRVANFALLHSLRS